MELFFRLRLAYQVGIAFFDNQFSASFEANAEVNKIKYFRFCRRKSIRSICFLHLLNRTLVFGLLHIKYFDDIRKLLRTMTQHSADDTYDLEAGSLFIFSFVPFYIITS